MIKKYIGVDLGGTTLSAGIVDENGNILHKKTIPTNLPKTEAEIEYDIKNLCDILCKENGYNIDSDIESIGLGFPGSVDNEIGIIWSNPNFNDENWMIKSHLSKLFNIPLFIENDANAALMGEAYAGSAKGYKNVVMITIGTGIGGGALINGKIYTGVNDAALEVGHMVIHRDGIQCNCGRKGCFERYASASALVNKTKNELLKENHSLIWNYIDDINQLNAKVIFDAYKLEDYLSKKILDEYISDLSCGIINIINIFQPELFLIGGGISNQGDFLLDLIKPYIESEEFAKNTSKRCIIKTAKFTNDAGIIGAALVGANNVR